MEGRAHLYEEDVDLVGDVPELEPETRIDAAIFENGKIWDNFCQSHHLFSATLLLNSVTMS